MNNGFAITNMVYAYCQYIQFICNIIPPKPVHNCDIVSVYFIHFSCMEI